MERSKTIVKLIGTLVLFSLFIYLVVIGQMNIGLVKWITKRYEVTNIRPIGLSVMIVGLIGLLSQLYFYNKKYR